MRIPNMMILIVSLFFSQAIFAADAQETSPEIQGDTLAASIERGKKTFNTVCILCHHPDHQVGPTGCPGLKDVLTRHDAAWLDQWLSGPEKFSKTDVKAKAVVDANPYHLIMPTLPEMQDEKNRHDMIEFLKTLK